MIDRPGRGSDIQMRDLILFFGGGGGGSLKHQLCVCVGCELNVCHRVGACFDSQMLFFPDKVKEHFFFFARSVFIKSFIK